MVNTVTAADVRVALDDRANMFIPTFIVHLAKGQSAWNPTSTKEDRAIHGPATVTYKEYPSQIHCTVEDGKHVVQIRSSSKMDAVEMSEAYCTCGYRSGTASVLKATNDGEQHRIAKDGTWAINVVAKNS